MTAPEAMVDDVTVDLATAAACAGLSIADLKALADDGDLVVIDHDHIATGVITAWIERDRAARRQALVALATGIAAEVFY